MKHAMYKDADDLARLKREILGWAEEVDGQCICTTATGTAYCHFVFSQPTKCKCSTRGGGGIDCRWEGQRDRKSVV